jgi:fatty-acyl-CoA synthase
MAVLEMLDGAAFDPVALADFLAAQPDLGTKWAPRFVRLTDRIPLTGTGKVDKRPLRVAPWSTADPVWWRPLVGRKAHTAGAEDGPVYRRLTAEDVEALGAQYEAHGRRALLEM